jgi:molecular chaperone DnaK
MTNILGIDLGTTKSVVAIWRDNAPHIIPDAEEHTLTPSVIALDPKDGQWKVGYSAQALAVDTPSAAIYSIKRFIGRRFSEDMVQESLQNAQHHV